MIQLLYPLGLLASAAIIIPVVIHLWNIKQGKTLKIGSIALLGESSRQSSRSLRITDWPLLILRCLLLAALALLLANPVFRSVLKATPDKGWVIIEKRGLKLIDPAGKKTMDSLLNIGYELHELTTDFPALSIGDTSHLSLEFHTPLSYISLIKHLNTILPAGYKVYGFGENRLNRYTGDLPEISIDLHWNMISGPDTAKTWVSGAYFTGKDQLRTILTHSTPSKNYREVVDMTDIEARAKKIELRIDSGKTKLKTVEQNEWIDADTSTVKVAIYETGSGNDRTYIRSAITAIRQFTDRKISITDVSNSRAVPVSSDVIFWLSDVPADTNILKDLKEGAAVFNYERGKMQKISSVVNTRPQSGSIVNRPELYKRIRAGKDNGIVLWTDGFGFPVLTLERTHKLRRYHFYTRFDPQYTSLVWNDEFVKALMPVIIPVATTISDAEKQYDMRQETTARLLTNRDLKDAGLAGIYRNTPINNILWLLAILLFAAERIVTFNKNR